MGGSLFGGRSMLKPSPALHHRKLDHGAGWCPRMERSRSILLLDVNLLGDCQRIIHLDTEIAHGTFYLRVSK